MPTSSTDFTISTFFALLSNGRQTVGDGAFYVDAAPSVLAVCQVQGEDEMYYYSTTFSGGPGVRTFYTIYSFRHLLFCSGGFDVPKSKCPPHGGSSGCVTGSPALDHSTAFNHPFYSSPSKDPQCNQRQDLVYPPTPPIPADAMSFPHSPVGPQPILGAPRAENFSHGLATPPLTPDDFIEDVSVKSNDDALELLTTLFPNHALMALPHAKSVSISSPEMGTSFDGVVLELPGKPKTFYVDGKSAEVVNVRERYVIFWFKQAVSLIDLQHRCALGSCR
jgi:hypothetical protein